MKPSEALRQGAGQIEPYPFAYLVRFDFGALAEPGDDAPRGCALGAMLVGALSLDEAFKRHDEWILFKGSKKGRNYPAPKAILAKRWPSLLKKVRPDDPVAPYDPEVNPDPPSVIDTAPKVFSGGGTFEDVARYLEGYGV